LKYSGLSVVMARSDMLVCHLQMCVAVFTALFIGITVRFGFVRILQFNSVMQYFDVHECWAYASRVTLPKRSIRFWQIRWIYFSCTKHLLPHSSINSCSSSPSESTSFLQMYPRPSLPTSSALNNSTPRKSSLHVI
jgi:hypothetical protein